MNTYQKIAVVAALLVAVVAVVAIKSRQKQAHAAPALPATSQPTLPRLVDVGSHNCIPCKKMAPILDDLRKEYAGRLTVDFVDIADNPDAGDKYVVRLIPTQIFYDASGKERFRHEGFMSKEDILAQWSKLGIPLAAPPEQ